MPSEILLRNYEGLIPLTCYLGNSGGGPKKKFFFKTIKNESDVPAGKPIGETNQKVIRRWCCYST